MNNEIKMKRKWYLGLTKAQIELAEEENDKDAQIGSIEEEKEEKCG